MEFYFIIQESQLLGACGTTGNWDMLWDWRGWGGKEHVEDECGEVPGDSDPVTKHG